MLGKENWIYSLKNLPRFVKECRNNRYRFNLPYVKISSIAEQYYCEVKVHNEYKFGEISTEAKEEGRKIHEELIKMKPINIEKLVHLIKSRSLYSCTFPVYAKINELTIIGVPDLIVFKNLIPYLLIELKTTCRNINEVWLDEKIQIKTYAYALDYMGFDCNRLSLIIIKIKRDKNIPPREILDIVIISHLTNKLNKLKVIEKKLNFRTYNIAYSKEEILKKLYWAKDYWLEKRNPIPTRNINKCKACPYKRECKSSLR